MSLIPLIRTRILTPTCLASNKIPTRPLTTNPHLSQQRMGNNPQSNQPDSVNASVRKDTPNTDNQSSASTEEHKKGDDHPAKQPDAQAEPSQKTGIGGGREVKGGKEGLGERGDR